MSVFMIETGNVDSASSAMEKIASQLSDLSSSVSGYDTSCEDGFDFASAKNVIASNIEACVTKVKNTASILNTVSQTHTQLQSSLKYKEDESSTNSGGKSGGSSGSSYSGGGYSGGGGGGGYSSGGYSAAASPIAATTAALRKTDDKTTKDDEIVEIKNNFKSVGYVYINTEKLNDDAKEVFKNKDFKYDENGYAKIGDRYVVAVDESIAKEGDILKFTQEDGTEIEVVVGLTTKGTKYKDRINFVMKTDKGIDEETMKITEDILKNNKKIEKVGNILPKKEETTTTSTSTPASTSSSTGTVSVTGSNVMNGNIIDTSEPVGTGAKYNLTDDDLAFLGYVASSEQGSVDGAKLELSLMANLYEENKGSFSSVRDYVENSGWFGSSYGSEYSYPGDEYIAVAKDVLVNGNRYLASNVVEHDCLSDIESCSTGDVYDKSCYIPGETVLENVYGAKYVFVGFAPNEGDPFGYLIN